jgi:hypothetical protein
MPEDELVRTLNEITRAMWDPTAPLPTVWPGGALGVFLIFATQIGAGIPLGVIRARDAGLHPAFTSLLYVASDVVLAVTMEPMLAGLRWVSRRVPFLARIGTLLGRLSGGAGLQEGGVRGPLGLILVSFSVSPTFGRAASEAAGHGFLSGWTLAIIGDMLYFWLVMAGTLWVSSLLGDDRLAIGAVLIATWVLPLVIRRLRKRPAAAQVRVRPALRVAHRPATLAPAPATSPFPASASASTASAGASTAARKRASQPGRRRATRGLHR